MMYISKEQTAGCYPVFFTIQESPRNLEIKYELIFWFGDYPMVVKRSSNKKTLEKHLDKILQKSKLDYWNKERKKIAAN